MGVAHSVDSCSSGKEAKKDDLLEVPSIENSEQYMNRKPGAYNEKPLPRAMPDASRSVQNKLGVKQHDIRDKDASIEMLKSTQSNNNDNHSRMSSSVGSSSTRWRRRSYDDHHQHHRHHGLHIGSGRLSGGFNSFRRSSVSRVRHVSSSVIGKVSHAAHAVGQGSMRLFHQYHNQHDHHHHRPTIAIAPKVKGGVLLRGCLTDEEHKHKAKDIVDLLRSLTGEEALRASGFEFRKVKLDEKGEPILPPAPTSRSPPTLQYAESPLPGLIKDFEKSAVHHENDAESNIVLHSHDDGGEDNAYEGKPSVEQGDQLVAQDRKDQSQNDYDDDSDDDDDFRCTCQSDTNENRPGDSERTTSSGRKSCVEYAQEVMIRKGDLEWVTIAEAGNNPEPIRAIVSRRLLEDESKLDRDPTLLIATGKGKVRAGIFSRQHLMQSGLECSTALPIVREARKRKMNVVMVDPNVHGDRLGMITFEKSMERLFRRWETRDENPQAPHQPPLSHKDLFVLSHSQSGAQLARYLLDKSEHYIPHIRAIAFTDSTHNIQWAQNKDSLKELLESENCIYFKCSKESNDNVLNPLRSVGEVVDTDDYWRHRFGTIKTMCAGTSEHSLTNWFVRNHIWDHFDKFGLSSRLPPTAEEDDDEGSLITRKGQNIAQIKHR